MEAFSLASDALRSAAASGEAAGEPVVGAAVHAVTEPFQISRAQRQSGTETSRLSPYAVLTGTMERTRHSRTFVRTKARTRRGALEQRALIHRLDLLLQPVGFDDGHAQAFHFFIAVERIFDLNLAHALHQGRFVLICVCGGTGGRARRVDGVHAANSALRLAFELERLPDNVLELLIVHHAVIVHVCVRDPVVALFRG